MKVIKPHGSNRVFTVDVKPHNKQGNHIVCEKGTKHVVEAITVLVYIYGDEHIE